MNKIIRRSILAFALIAGFSPAFAQAPPPVPALPDAERRTSYVIAATTCICNVNFALYGDSTDYASWVEVYLNGVRVNFNDGTFGWTITSPTGALGSIPRPVTDAVLTFNGAQTGTVQIVGARRPRRTSTFAENRGVAARDLNQILNDMIAQNRETWDKTNDVTGRALMSQPGNTLSLLPLPSACQNKFLGFDATGLIPQCNAGGAGSGNVVGPLTSIVGNVALWNNVTGTLLKDSGVTLPTGPLPKIPELGGTVLASGFCQLQFDCQYTGKYFGFVTVDDTVVGRSPSSITDAIPGNTYSLNFVWTPNNITITYTAIGGDTVNSIAVSLCALINANTTIHSATTGEPIFCQANVGAAGLFNLQWQYQISLSVTSVGTGGISLAAQNLGWDYTPIQWGKNASPAKTLVAVENLISHQFTGPDSASNGALATQYGQFNVHTTNTTNGAQRGQFEWNTPNGSRAPFPRMALNGGLFLYDAAGAAPTGGDLGGGTINVPTSYAIAGAPIANVAGLFPPSHNIFGDVIASGVLNLQSTQSGSPSGDSVQVTAGGKVGYKFDGVTSTFGTSTSLLGKIAFANLTSGTIAIQPPAGALGSAVLTLPIATDTLMGKATTDILTNKTFDTAGAGNALSVNSVNVATAWTAFTPTPTCGTATITSASARSKTMGKTTWIAADFTITAIGTCAVTNVTFNLPNTAQAGASLGGRDTNSNKGINCSVAGAGTTAACLKSDVSTWNVNDHLVFSGVYENQ